jgi:hypothetical protein
MDQAVKHCLSDPAAAPARCDDDVFDVGAQNTVGHGARETDQPPAVPCANCRGAAQHEVYLLWRALGPPLCRTVEREYPVRWDRLFGVREDYNRVSVIHRDTFWQAPRPPGSGSLAEQPSALPGVRRDVNHRPRHGQRAVKNRLVAAWLGAPGRELRLVVPRRAAVQADGRVDGGDDK